MCSQIVNTLDKHYFLSIIVTLENTSYMVCHRFIYIYSFANLSSILRIFNNFYCIINCSIHVKDNRFVCAVITR